MQPHKFIYTQLTSNIILNCERLNAFPLRCKYKYTSAFTSIQHFTGSIGGGIS